MKRLALLITLFLLIASTVLADVTVTFIDVGQGDAVVISDAAASTPTAGPTT